MCRDTRHARRYAEMQLKAAVQVGASCHLRVLMWSLQVAGSFAGMFAPPCVPRVVCACCQVGDPRLVNACLLHFVYISLQEGRFGDARQLLRLLKRRDEARGMHVFDPWPLPAHLRLLFVWLCRVLLNRKPHHICACGRALGHPTLTFTVFETCCARVRVAGR
jgi:hypothetical protein